MCDNDGFDGQIPGYNPMSTDWKNNEPIPDGESARIPVDFFDDLGESIVEKYKNEPDKLKQIVESLVSVHTYHRAMNREEDLSLSKLFRKCQSRKGELSQLLVDISTFQGTWNKSKRTELGSKAIRVFVPFDDPKTGPPMAQFIVEGIGKSLRNNFKA